MKLIIGLGNIGNEYSKTRHNVGFIALDYYAKKNNLRFEKTKNYYYAKCSGALLIKPTTYMNLSGIAVQSVLTKYRNIDEILVIVDDLNLKFAKIRIRAKGSSGGHNGLKNISKMLGTDEYGRIRVGIGRPNSEEVKDFVLNRFTQDEQAKLTNLCEYLSELVDEFLNNGMQSLLDFNSSNYGKRSVDFLIPEKA